MSTLARRGPGGRRAGACDVSRLPDLAPALVAALLVASVYGEALTLGGLAISRLAAPVAALAAFAVWARAVASGLPALPLVWALAYAAWASASNLWTSTPAATVEQLWSLAIAFAFLLAFALLPRTRRSFDAVLVAFWLSALVCAGVVLAEAALSPGARSDGLVGDPNFAAVYQLVALPAALVLRRTVQAGAARRTIDASALVVVASVLATGSRGAVIALAAGLLALVLLPTPVLASWGVRRLPVLASVGALGVAVVLLLPGGSARIETIAGDAGTGSGRLNEWRAAAATAGDHPVLGIGYGAFASESNETMRRTPGVSFRDFELRDGGSQAHSTYLGTAAELGLVGLALLLGVVASTLGLLARLTRDAVRKADVAAAARPAALGIALVVWLVASAFLTTETSRPFWMLVGLSLALARLADTRPPVEHRVG